MRLRNLTGFELGGIAIDPGKPPDNTYEKCRLVVFVSDQAHPVYISEEFRLTPSHSTSLNEVSFANKSFHRSFRLAIQLWHLIDDEWKVADEWIVDLRQAREQPLKKMGSNPRLAIFTDAGTVLCYASPEEEELKQKALKQAAAEASSGDRENTNEDSLISRWLSWGKATTNGGTAAAAASAGGGGSSAKSKSTRRESLSYPMLVDLWSLQHSLDEARAASVELASRINEQIPSSALEWSEKQSVLERRLRIIQKNIKFVHTEIEKCRNKATKVRYGAQSLSTKLQESSEQASAEAAQKNNRHLSPATDLGPKIRYQQGLLASQIQEIFPIELVGDGRFHFAINGLMLPSVFAINQYDTAQIGAALGFVAQVVLCLSVYLDIPLPYPVTVYGSQSYITDNITQIKHGSNKFPLWTRGALLYRVEYALYLLHKDIEQILNAMELPVADLKQTLANLKNILLVLSSQRDTVDSSGSTANIEVPTPPPP